MTLDDYLSVWQKLAVVCKRVCALLAAGFLVKLD
jgi:hypothetical protein